MPEALIIEAVRTPIGRYRGALAGVRPDDLGAHAIAAAVERTGIEPADVADVYWGAANQAGEDNRNAARMCALLAGFPVEVPGVTVNRLCASGLEAVNQASRALRLGEGDLYVAGGAESMSRAPWVLPKPDAAFARGPQTMHDTALGWRLVNPRMEAMHSTEAMGETAENVAERLFDLTRGPGRVRAAKPPARDCRRRGRPVRRGDSPDRRAATGRPRRARHVARDEGPRADTTLEKLASLKPVFREGGSVTAGNASTLNDGAACLILAGEERAAALGREPLGRIVATGVAGVDPAVMGMGPVPAIRRARGRRRPGPGRHRSHRDQRGVCLAGAGVRPGAGP